MMVSFVALFLIHTTRLTKRLNSERQTDCVSAYYFVPELHKDVDATNASLEAVCHRRTEMRSIDDCTFELSVSEQQQNGPFNCRDSLTIHRLMSALCGGVSVKFHACLS